MTESLPSATRETLGDAAFAYVADLVTWGKETDMLLRDAFYAGARWADSAPSQSAAPQGVASDLPPTKVGGPECARSSTRANEDVLAKIEKALQHVFGLCQGNKWKMCVPVQRDDSDIILCEALEAARTALSATAFDKFERIGFLSISDHHTGLRLQDDRPNGEFDIFIRRTDSGAKNG